MQAGARSIGAPAIEARRIEAGFPWYGPDISEKNLPQELARDQRAISFTKGCYLGQETVARIDALGHVNQTLVGVRLRRPGGSDGRPGTECRGQRGGSRDERHLVAAAGPAAGPGVRASRQQSAGCAAHVSGRPGRGRHSADRRRAAGTAGPLRKWALKQGDPETGLPIVRGPGASRLRIELPGSGASLPHRRVLARQVADRRDFDRGALDGRQAAATSPLGVAEAATLACTRLISAPAVVTSTRSS